MFAVVLLDSNRAFRHDHLKIVPVRTENAVPTAMTSSSPAFTIKGFDGSFATWKKASPRSISTRRAYTGAGASSGLDFAITLVGKLRGRAYAQMLMLAAEYDPQPPIKGGTEERTDAAIVEPMRGMFAPIVLQVKEIAGSKASA